MPDRDIQLTRTIGAPPNTVFRALTDAGELARWFPSTADSDARPGGSFSYHFEFDDAARNHTYAGEYRELVPGERVSYPWVGKLGETQVEFRLRPSDGRTEVTLTHSGWGSGAEWKESLDMHRQGWGFFLENLKSYLERGEDLRENTMGMKTAARAT